MALPAPAMNVWIKVYVKGWWDVEFKNSVVFNLLNQPHAIKINEGFFDQ